MARAAELLQRAETLKSFVVDPNGNIDWDRRLELQQTLESAILTDADYAVTKHAEQILWNICFKSCIDAYQNKLRHRKTDGDAAVLQMFLDSCIGYFSLLIGSLCRRYGVRLDCYKSDASLGILNGHFTPPFKAEKSNVMYLSQFCLIHLGDIARYQKNVCEAESFYVHAWRVCPHNGHAFNQLAILETSRARHLSALYLYTRSLYVRNPFLLAAGNLEKFYETVDVTKTNNLTVTCKNLSSAFMHLFAAAHNFRELDDAEHLLKSISNASMEAFERDELQENDLEHLFVVTVGEIWKIISSNDTEDLASVASFCKDKLSPEDTENLSTNSSTCLLSKDEFRALMILIAAFRILLIAGTNGACKGRISFLPVLKKAFDFLKIHPSIGYGCTGRHLQSSEMISRHENYDMALEFFASLASFLNHIQETAATYRDSKIEPLIESYPLPEDRHLRGFLPLEKAHEHLNFEENRSSDVEETRLEKTRLIRLVAFGKFFAASVNNSAFFRYEEKENSTENENVKIYHFASKEIAEKRPSPGPISTKRQTKVVPLITILEREKEKEKAASKITEEIAEGISTAKKIVRVMSPSVSSEPKSHILPDRYDLEKKVDTSARFQAARLKQALTGFGGSENRMSAQFQMEPRPPFLPPSTWANRPPPPPPLMMGNGPPNIGASDFHRTPGVRPPGPPPFPPPPGLFSAPPPGFASPRFSGGPAVWHMPPPPPHLWSSDRPPPPMVFLGRDEDPHFKIWEENQRASSQTPCDRSEGAWGKTDWTWPERNQLYSGPELQKNVGGNMNLESGGPPAKIVLSDCWSDTNLSKNPNMQGSGNFVEDAKSSTGIEGQFSLFGTGGTWEFKAASNEEK